MEKLKYRITEIVKKIKTLRYLVKRQNIKIKNLKTNVSMET